MTFKPAVWHPITVVLSAVNLVAVGLATGSAEPWHATGHAALALGFGLWAARLRQVPVRSVLQDRPDVLEALEALETEVNNLGRELGETQERLDFAERLLAQGAESRRVGPER